jgi:FKBP-type peptidyl-prolyl cis-trans isomerase FklB
VCFVTSVTISFYSCTAQAPKASLKTDIDTLSYAVGLANTEGLEGYLLQQGMDSAYVKDFIAGFLEGSKIKKGDKKAEARMMGINIGHNFMSNFDNISRNILGEDTTKVLSKDNLIAGFVDGARGKQTIMPRENANDYVRVASEKLRAEALEKMYGEEKKANQKYLDDNKSKDGVVTLPSGLQYKVLVEGKGAKPTATDRVKVLYEGKLINDTIFDSTAKRNNEPATFGVGQVIKGWTEGLQLMPVGSKYQFFIPYDLAYGANGSQPNIPPFATLIFEVELLDIVK